MSNERREGGGNQEGELFLQIRPQEDDDVDMHYDQNQQHLRNVRGDSAGSYTNHFVDGGAGR
jgi:hypothetical protein